jgi:hypothetical protein
VRLRAGTHGQSSACGAFDFFFLFFLADLNGFLHILNGLKSRLSETAAVQLMRAKKIID